MSIYHFLAYIYIYIYIYTACFFDNNISWSLDTTIKIDQSCDLKVMGSNFENISFICSDKTVHIYASSSSLFRKNLHCVAL